MEAGAARLREAHAAGVSSSRQSRTGSGIPFRRSAPANAQRADGHASLTLAGARIAPGGVTSQMRLARFTGSPNQSPPRASATPCARPPRSRGKSGALGVGRRQEGVGCGEQRPGLRCDEHRAVAEGLHEGHRRVGDGGRDGRQALGDVAEPLRAGALSERGEADEVGKEDGDLVKVAWVSGAELRRGDRRAAELCAQVLLDGIGRDRARHRQQLRRGEREAVRELMLALPGTQHGLAGGLQHRRCHLGRGHADVAVEPQELLLGEPQRECLLRVPRLLDVGVAETALVGGGDGETERGAQAADRLHVEPGSGGDVGRRVRLARRVERALDGEQDEPPLGDGTAQVVQRHAPVQEVVQQGDALGALARIVQIVEQPLGLEVDRHECSVAAGWPHPTRSRHGFAAHRSVFD